MWYLKVKVYVEMKHVKVIFAKSNKNEDKGMDFTSEVCGESGGKGACLDQLEIKVCELSK